MPSGPCAFVGFSAANFLKTDNSDTGGISLLVEAVLSAQMLEGRTIYLSREGALTVRALASHRCGPGSIPGLDVICGLSLLLPFSSLLWGVFSGFSGFPLSTKPTFLNSNSTWNARSRLKEFLELGGAPWVNKLHLHLPWGVSVA